MQTCGVVMPISATEGCSAEHWARVLEIFRNSAKHVNFAASLVSASSAPGIIHDAIVNNLYDSDVVVCDVSCSNPNVMFELGMRLAFDKPVIVVKDDQTKFSFDTGVIEHLIYPRSLEYQSIQVFMQSLSERIFSLYRRSNEDNFSMFLKHFGEFAPARRYVAEKVVQDHPLYRPVNAIISRYIRSAPKFTPGETWAVPLDLLDAVMNDQGVRDIVCQDDEWDTEELTRIIRHCVWEIKPNA